MAEPRPHVAALIVAAGSGERAGNGLPKQYRILRGKPMVVHAVEHLRRHDAVTSVRVVIRADHRGFYDATLGDAGLEAPVIGAADRQGSVRAGLEAVAADGGADMVLIHDAARPFCPPQVIDRLIDALADHDGAIPIIPVTDSLARADGTGVARADYVQVQTPQAFRFEQILMAHREWTGDRPATDDAEIARATDYDITLITGDTVLKKYTFTDDFISPVSIRTGFGYDVHAFASGDHLWLGGVRIAHDRTLAGHSDADVALHAATDAILGAIAAGDIGDHFSPSDPQWEGAASDRFLAHAAALAAERGYRIEHLDITIVCEAPKIGPHRSAMRTRIAEILAIGVERVSVKATTTERLGFTGRGEGIAAQAVVTLAGEGGE